MCETQKKRYRLYGYTLKELTEIFLKPVDIFTKSYPRSLFRFLPTIFMDIMLKSPNSFVNLTVITVTN